MSGKGMRRRSVRAYSVVAFLFDGPSMGGYRPLHGAADGAGKGAGFDMTQQRQERKHEQADTGCAAQAAVAGGAVVRFWRDEALDAVEVRYSHFNGYRFPAHVHDTWSVGLVDEGHSIFRLAGRGQDVQAGQIAVIPPGAVHDCNPDVGAWTYRMFYVQDSLMRALARDISDGDGTAASMGTDAVTFDSLVIDDAEVFAALSAFQRIVARQDSHGVDALERRSAMTEAFSQLLARHAAVRETSRRDDRGAVRRVREYLADHLDAKVTLEDLSAVSGLSGYHLLRVFRAEVGLTPHQWQTQLRINHAKTLLAKGTPIADAACATGFTDQSHFTRIFRSVTGATPRLYRLAGAAG